MDKFIVVIFDSEPEAYEGLWTLQDLDHEASINLYAKAVIVRDATGRIVVKQPSDTGSIGAGVNLFTWSLIGLFHGPNRLDTIADPGMFEGAFSSLAKCGVGEDFLYEVGQSLQTGHAAVIAEVWEEGTTPVDNRMESLNGMVFRRIRREILNPLIKRDIVVLRAELEELEAEIDRSNGKTMAKLNRKVNATRIKLQDMQTVIQERITASRQETKAKIDSLQEKADRARGDKKSRFEKRIAELQSEQERRNDLLNQAQELIKESLFA